MSRTRGVVLGVVLACGCGGGGDGGGGGGGSAPRQWDRVEVATDGASLPGLAITGGVVDLAYRGRDTVGTGMMWQELGGTPEMIERATASLAGRPAVGRDGSGVVHVAWATTSPDEIRYAVRDAGAWTVESVATDRFRPDLAVAADGTVHLAFVDEETGNAMAYHATRGSSGWDIEAVHGTNWIAESQVGIALTSDGLPVIAGSDSNGAGVWVAEADAGGAWTVTPLAAERENGGVVDLAVGDAGVAVAFKDGRYTIVAWRPAGSSEWSVEDASRHDSSDGSIAAAVGPAGPMVVSDVDVEYPNGTALLDRTSDGWHGQLLGPSSCGDGGFAIDIDATGQPAIAIVCNYDVIYYMTVVGTYPDDWDEQCAAAASEMCGPACTCGTDGEDCCWSSGNGSICTSSFGCAPNAVGTLCGDPTVDPADLQACRDELSSLTCSVDGPLDLTGACADLAPF